MSNVNFGGFRNTGVAVNDIYDSFGKRKARMAIFNCELTDNFMGKDLTLFSPIFKKSSNAYNKNILNFVLWKCMERDNPEYMNSVFVINNDKYEMNMENLGIFEKVAKILKEVITTPKHLFAVANDWLQSEDCTNNFLLPDNLDSGTLKAMHMPENVKSVAHGMLDEMTNSVAEYLEY